jgi:hypothetical protein
MKHLIGDFRKFLIETNNNLENYDHGGQVTLYHYTSTKQESLVLDPEHKKSHYSRREFDTASTPRVFFYLDPSQKERFFSSSTLYTATVPAARVYDFRNDPLGYRQVQSEEFPKGHRHPVYGLRKGMEWDEILEDIREDFGGIYYSTANFDVVAWFKPIEVTPVSDEEKAALEEA